ncbi:MAG: cellulase family glycosylhydrolase [Cellulomonas sp.]
MTPPNQEMSEPIVQPSENFVRTGRHFLNQSGRAIVPVGAHFVPPSGPDWPWRESVAAFDSAFAQMAAAGLTTVRIDLLWAAMEPLPGALDEAHLTVLDQILSAAERHGLSFHPTLFVGGEVGDAYWDLPWAQGRNPHTDDELIQLQVAHASALARRWRGRPALIAWDLTDEPPFWIHASTTTDDDARRWTASVADALREADPEHLVTVGTASQEIDHGPFRADVIAPYLDFCCVHPYPIYSPELYPDGLTSVRMTLAGAFETALARGAGRPVMVHEYGASSTQFSPERIADYDRLLCWSSFGRGAVGFYAWCWIDAEPAAFRRSPYVRMPHETQFGVLTHDGQDRPRLAVLTGLARALDALDLDGLAGDGPRTDASMLVPHEYVHPYDPAAYGLSDAPAGPYAPAERAWNPAREVTPLVRGWLNGFILAARAGLSVDFPREQLDGSWPDSPLVLAPAPLTTTTNSLLHLRTSTWSNALSYVEAGGALYLSCSAETAIPELAELAGVSIADRAPVVSDVRLTFVAQFGDLEVGDVLVIPSGSTDLHLRGVRLDVTDAQVLAVDSSGLPALTRATRGRGSVTVCAYPVELLQAEIPDAHSPQETLWRLYRAVADTAGVRPVATADHENLVCGVLAGPRGGILTVTNHSPVAVDAPLRLPVGAHQVMDVLDPAAIPNDTSATTRRLKLAPFAAAVVTWQWPST